ncbi:MAG: hypothetical protein ACOC8B_06950, partial [Gemmatimonadota bacterium]
ALTMTADEVLKRLADWGRGDFSPFLTEGGGLDLTSPTAREHIGLLRKVKIKERMIATDEDEPPILERRTEVELHDAKDAVDKIAKVHGLYVDRHEHAGPGGGPIQTNASVTFYVPDNGRGDGAGAGD